MPDAPDFAVRPPLRCFHRYEDLDRGVCGASAVWQTPAAHGWNPRYWCELHRPGGAEPIPAAIVFRRVSLQVEVLFASTSIDRDLAHAEALRTLARAVESVGGWLSLTSVTSVVGRHVSQAPAPAGRGEPGMG